MTIWPHLPSAIPRSDEAICCCSGRVAKNFGVKSRINSVQAAWHHRPVAIATAVAIRPSRRRSGAENAQGGGDRKRDESLPSTHGDFLLLSEATRIESRAHCEPGKDRLVNDLLGHLKATWSTSGWRRPVPLKNLRTAGTKPSARQIATLGSVCARRSDKRGKQRCRDRRGMGSCRGAPDNGDGRRRARRLCARIQVERCHVA
jgi:hypothetical protein